jgi:hypothetical protein
MFIMVVVRSREHFGSDAFLLRIPYLQYFDLD